MRSLGFRNRSRGVHLVLLLGLVLLGILSQRRESGDDRDGGLAGDGGRVSGSGRLAAVDAEAGGRGVRVGGESRVVRGPNQRLLFSDPVVVEPVAGRVFNEAVFRVRRGALAGGLSENRFTLSAVEAAADAGVVARLMDSRAEAFEVPLEVDRTALVRVKKVVSRGEVTHTVVGSVVGDPLSQVVLVFHD
ncbi:MAG: hypothetical protein ACQCXQ_13945, partial [Verrucomicrobiales bacterium]